MKPSNKKLKKTGVLKAFLLLRREKLVVFLSLLVTMVAQSVLAQNYTASPTGWTSKPTGSITYNGNTYIAATTDGVYIRAKAVVNSDNTITFSFKKSSGTFQNTTAAQLFKDLNGSNHKLLKTVGAYSGDTEASVTITPDFTSGNYTYTFLLTSTNSAQTRFCTSSITITAKLSTPNYNTFYATNIGTKSFTANWGSVTGATKYGILVRTVGGSYSNPVFQNEVSSTSCNVTNLQPNTSYEFQIQARNGSQTSDWSKSIQTPITTFSDKLPTPNYNTFYATNIGTKSFTANWGSVTGATKYGILVRTVGGSYSNPVFQNEVSSTSCNVTNLQPNTSYEFQIQARNGSQTSDWSKSIQTPITTLSDKLPTPNYNTFYATNIGTKSFTANWESVTGATKYGILVRTVGGSYNNPVFQNEVSSTSCNVTNLQPNTSYEFQIQARNGSQTSDWSKSIQTPITTLSSSTDDMTPAQAAEYLQEKGVVDSGDPSLTGDLLRQQLAKVAFRGLYSISGRSVGSVPSDNYPTVYSDIENSYAFQAIRALLYLEYDDDVTPFDRNRFKFEPENTIARVDVLKVLLETFDIKPNASLSNPFPNDANVSSMKSNGNPKYGYIAKAAELGIIKKPSNGQNTEFRPFAYCTRGEAFTMLARIMKKIEAGNITDPNPGTNDYFEPLNTTLATISLGASLPMGNFEHYTKSSFTISGVVPLVFAHTYNSYNTTLPEAFYGANDNGETYQPLGEGWSHNFHTYVTLVGKISDKTARAVVHWGGGNFDIYKSDGSNMVPESYGVYDTFIVENGGATIKTKSQMIYRFTTKSNGGPNVLYLSSIEDRNGNILTLNYETGENSCKRISSVSDGSRSLTFSYRNGTNLVSKVSDPLGRSIKFGYEINSNTGRYQLSTFTDAKGQKTTYIYGNQSKTSKLLTKIQMPKGNYIENTYDANNRRLTQTENGTSKTTVHVNTTYGSYGATASTSSTVEVTRKGSTPSTYKYAFNSNNMMTSMSGPKNLSMSSTYGNSTHPWLPTAITTNSTDVSNIVYDSKGNVTQIDVTGDGQTLTTKMTYDSMNNMTSVTDPKGNKTTYSYDSKGNLTGVSAPEGVSTSISFNAKGLPTSVTNPMNVETQFDYNSYGNLTKTTLPALGLTTSSSYDRASRLISSTDALGRTTSFVYDDNDNLTSETDPANHTTSYGYDANDNMTSITNAKGGVTSMSYDNVTDWLTSVEFAGTTKKYDYNKDGTISSFTKPDGSVLSYSYDDLGRVTDDGINTYTYDSQTLNLKSVTSKTSGKTLSFSYDGFNRITGTSYDGHSNSYTYDKNGNCTSINNTSYSYDKLNRLTSVSFNGKTISYTYRKDSQLSEVSYPNGMTTTYGYDGVGRLISKKTTLSNGTVVVSYSFELDKFGNITKQITQEPYNEIILENEDVNYSYNSGNRITKAGDISFSFDANGNTTKRGSEQYSWDKSDRLIKVGSTSITYDPFGLIASYGNITFTTDPQGIGNVLSDSKSGAEYIYGDGLEGRMKNGKASYYVTDFRGSVVAIVDDNGNITHKYQYDEYGKVTQKQEADYNPFQYVGKYGVMYLNDHQYYMRARHYDPTIGRFLSEDPIWSTNLHPYADNNPIMNIDPLGNVFNEIGRTHVNTSSGGGQGPSGAKSIKTITNKAKREICKVLTDNEECKTPPRTPPTKVEKKLTDIAQDTNAEILKSWLLDQGVKQFKQVKAKALEEVVSFGHSVEKGVTTAINYVGEGIINAGTYIWDNRAQIGGYVVGAVVIAGSVYLVIQTGGTATAPAYALVLATI